MQDYRQPYKKETVPMKDETESKTKKSGILGGLALVVVVIIVIGGGLAYGMYWFFNLMHPTIDSGTTPLPATTTPVVTPTPTATTTVKAPAKTTTTVKKPTAPKATAPKTAGIGRYSYLYNLKAPLVCTVKTLVGTKRTGTMYIGSNKMRVNFTSSSMIDDGANLYAWTLGATKGVVLPASASASGSVIASSGGFDPANDISYSCNAWVESPSTFYTPTGITFSNTR